MTEGPRRICVIRLSSLGDLILMVPLLEALRASFSESEITLVTKAMYCGLFEGNPFLDHLITVKRGDLRELMQLRRELNHARFDLLIDAHNVIRSNVLFHTVRAGRKLQIAKDEIRKLLLIRGKMNLYRHPATQQGRYAALGDRLGLRVNAEGSELPIPSAARDAAARLVAGARREGGALVAFAPGARWPTKRWPREYFVSLIEGARERGHATVLVGGPEDAPSNAEIASDLPHPPLDLTGQLTIIESAAVLGECDALVTNDSAPLHLAEAVGTPVVALYGPTVREFGYFPRLPRSVALEAKLPCRPCSRNGARACPYGTKECLTLIRPELALQTLLAVLDTRRVPV